MNPSAPGFHSVFSHSSRISIATVYRIAASATASLAQLSLKCESQVSVDAPSRCLLPRNPGNNFSDRAPFRDPVPYACAAWLMRTKRERIDSDHRVIVTEIHDALLGPEALATGVFRNKATMPAVRRRDEADRWIVGDFCGEE